jgi:hypothetical protein
MVMSLNHISDLILRSAVFARVSKDEVVFVAASRRMSPE